MSYQAKLLVSALERAFQRVERAPLRMSLTREDRLALFAGQTPKLTFPGAKPCPVKVGHVEVLSKNVRLEVTGVRRTAKGEHALVYVLHNDKLGARFMANQHGQAHPEQYVTSPAGAIDPEAGQAVDDFTQRRITRESRERERQEHADFVVAAENVLSVIKGREAVDPGMRRAYWPLRRELDRAIQRERRRVA